MNTITVLFIAAMSAMIGLLGGSILGYWEWVNRAVKAGKAEYYLDENNERQWRWK